MPHANQQTSRRKVGISEVSDEKVDCNIVGSEGGQMVDYKKLTRASGRWSIEDSSYLCRERKIVAKSKGWNLQTRNFENLSITKNPSDNAGADFTTPNFGPIDFESNLMGVIGVETDATICPKTNQSSTWRLNLILVMGNQVNWS